MICQKCGKTVERTFRINPKGEEGIYWCIECCINGGIEIDASLYEMTRLIDEAINGEGKNDIE